MSTRSLMTLALCAALTVAAPARFSFAPSGVSAQMRVPPNPCGSGMASDDAFERGFDTTRTHGLFPAAGGRLVYDANLGVCWLADANLAGNREVRDVLGVTGINPDGTMDYATALAWVDALNHVDAGGGLLGHNDWQLPATPHMDLTCSSQNVGNFGISCTKSALGNLYNVGLAVSYPDSVVPSARTFVWPFLDLQPGLYWTVTPGSTDSGETGQSTFSFKTGLSGANTTKYNFLHVLAMTTATLGPLPLGDGVLPYLEGPAAGRAVYDTKTGISWLLNANLAAKHTFGVTTTTTITSNINNKTYTVPLVDNDGAMLYSAADPTATDGWIAGLNNSDYAGTNTWTLPAIDDLTKLYKHMIIEVGDPRLGSRSFVGPFLGLQPGFYWSCERDPGTTTQAPCDPALHPGFAPGPDMTPMEWSFNFDDGFQGTDENNKLFYVMVYFPAHGVTVK